MLESGGPITSAEHAPAEISSRVPAAGEQPHELDLPARRSRVRALRSWRALSRTRGVWLTRAGADWALDGSTLLFALWTVCAHATVLHHGSGSALFVTFAFALPCSLALLGWRRPWRTARAPAPDRLELDQPEPRSAPRMPWLTLGGLCGALAVLLAWQQLHDPWYFWLHAVAFLLISAGFVFARPLSLPDVTFAQPSARQGAWLWLLALAGAALTASMNRPNSDDALYVNIAATVADHPEYELFARDTLHGHGMTLMRAYAAASVELFAGWIGWLTHTSALRIMHLFLAPIAGGLTAFAYARLFRVLEPRRWLWLTAAVLLFYVLDGAPERTVAGHGFIRMFQGKAMLATMGVPLIAANAIAFALRPSRWRWLLLAASVVMGIGLSSTGMWLALLTGMTGLVVPMRWERSYFEALAWGALALLYPLLFALWMRAQIGAASGGHAFDYALPRTLDEAAASATGMRYELSALAQGEVAHVYLALALLAWPLARGALARRYLLLFVLGGFAVLLNPVLSTFVAANLTGNATYSRVLWYVPFAAAFAICACAAIPESTRNRLALGAGALITILALSGFHAGYPTLATFEFLQFPPQVKGNPEGCKVSRYLAKHMADDQTAVLAPVAVSLCLPMVQHSPYAVMTKPKFFDDGGHDRFALRRIVERGGRVLLGRPRARFIGALEDYNVRGVVLKRGVEQTTGVVSTLEIAGFHQAEQFPNYLVFLRDDPWPSKAPGS